MSVDKRTVSTDALETLGTIITGEEKRDAIHLAVLPVTAAVLLGRGTRIRLENGKALPDEEGPGIVDPFLERFVKPGQVFWMVLKPRIIKSLRHVWSHPDFEDETGTPAIETGKNKAESELWLRAFCERSDCPSYEITIAAALGSYSDGEDVSGENQGDYIHFSGADAHGDIPYEFWDHLEVVSGQKIAIRDRAEYFSCSC